MSKRTRFSAKASVVTEVADWASDKAKRHWRRSRRRGGGAGGRRQAGRGGRALHRVERRQQRNAEGRKPGKPAPPLPDEPDPKAQRNYHRSIKSGSIMKSKEGFVQAYNAQAAVDAEAQIIVAHELTQCGSVRANWCPWSKPSKTISAASQSRPQPDSGYHLANPISKRS